MSQFSSGDETKLVSDIFEEAEDTLDFTFFIFSYEVMVYAEAFLFVMALIVYMVHYHSLKLIDDDDDRHKVYPDHDFKNDQMCRCNIMTKCCFWCWYVFCFLVFGILCIVTAASPGMLCSDDDDDTNISGEPCEEETGREQTRMIFLGLVVFGAWSVISGTTVNLTTGCNRQQAQL